MNARRQVTALAKRIARVALGTITAVAFQAQAWAGTITYYHNDLAGSPVAATNEAGQLIWRESYRPYGERLTNSAASIDNDVWFTSRRQDESGLVYMGARYYDPVVGRFLSMDPKGFDESNVHSHNRYAYANNNPYRYKDPDGRMAQVIEGLVILGLIGLTVYAFSPGVKKSTDAAAAAAVRGMFSEKAEASEGKEAGPNSGVPSNVGPGPNAGESVPAGPSARPTKEQQDKINEIGDRDGCHTCGTRDPGTKSGNWVGDHQDPNKLNPEGKPQSYYPQCLNCSNEQGGRVRWLPGQ